MSETQQLAKVVRTALAAFFIGFAFVDLVGFVDSAFGPLWFSDSTDSPTKRSGMSLYIDHETGCHYLANRGGTLIKRMTKEGKHYCE